MDGLGLILISICQFLKHSQIICPCLVLPMHAWYSHACLSVLLRVCNSMACPIRGAHPVLANPGRTRGHAQRRRRHSLPDVCVPVLSADHPVNACVRRPFYRVQPPFHQPSTIHYQPINPSTPQKPSQPLATPRNPPSTRHYLLWRMYQACGRDG